jgi:predicted AAA+ superfamily ATPase
MTLPQTKRFLFEPLCNFIDEKLALIHNGEMFKCGDTVVCITGPRHCGKTTIIQQLKARYSNRAYHKEFYDDEDYYTLFEDVSQANAEIVLIDEICKADNKAQKIFCRDVKNLQNYGKVVVFTGSSPKVLNSLSDTIGRGCILELPILMYTEYLKWNNLASSNNNFISYLHFIDDTLNTPQYITQVVNDTSKSYLNRFGEYYNLTLADVIDVTRYLAIKQNEVTLSKYPDIPNFGEIENGINALLREINCRTQGMTKERKQEVLKLLDDSGLIREYSSYSGDNELVSNGKDIFIFAYPWLFTDLIKIPDSNLGRIEDIWVEAVIVDRVSRVYDLVGKVRRADGSREIDIIYSYECCEYYALEIKNRSYSNARKSKNKSKEYSYNLGLKGYVFTCSEDTVQDNTTNDCIPNHTLMQFLENNITKLITNELFNRRYEYPPLINSLCEN